MKKKNIKALVIQNLILLIPFILYGVFKNGYLIYERGLINFASIFKPLYLIIISIFIKCIIDLILYRKIKFDYNLLSLVLVAMIMPYNINLLVYTITLLFTYLISLFLNKKFKLNTVCFIYLITVLVNSLMYSFTYQNILESTFNYNFSYFDLLMGRNIGGIASTSIFFCLIIYIYLTNNIYYKKNIPLAINITYLFLALIFFLITKNNNYLLNSELLFGSIFISTLPLSSPYRRLSQIFYGIFIGLVAFIVAVCFNSTISIYIATMVASLFVNIPLYEIINNKTVKNLS